MKMTRRSKYVWRIHFLVFVVAGICFNGCAHLSGIGNETACAPPLAPVVDATIPHSAGYLKSGPLVQGDIVAGPAQKTATERLLEQSEQIGALQQQVTTLRQHIVSLQGEIANKESLLRHARQEIEQATGTLTECQSQFASWHQEAAELRAYISQQDRRHAAAVKSLSQRLETLITQYENNASELGKNTEISLGPVDELGLQ